MYKVDERQLTAYLLWLKDRGLEGPIKFAASARRSVSDDEKWSEISSKEPGEIQGGRSIANCSHDIPTKTANYDAQPNSNAALCRTIFLGDSWHLTTTEHRNSAAIPIAEECFSVSELDLLKRMQTAMELAQVETQYMGLSGLQSRNFEAVEIINQTDRLQLIADLRMFNPKIVVCMGRLAMAALIGSTNFHGCRGQLLGLPHLGPIRVLVTWHPRDLIRYPANKRQAWADMKIAMSVVRTSAKSN